MKTKTKKIFTTIIVILTFLSNAFSQHIPEPVGSWDQIDIYSPYKYLRETKGWDPDESMQHLLNAYITIRAGNFVNGTLSISGNPILEVGAGQAIPQHSWNSPNANLSEQQKKYNYWQFHDYVRQHIPSRYDVYEVILTLTARKKNGMFNKEWTTIIPLYIPGARGLKLKDVVCTNNREYKVLDLLNIPNYVNYTDRKLSFNDKSAFTINNDGNSSLLISLPGHVNVNNQPSINIMDSINELSYIIYSYKYNNKTIMTRIKNVDFRPAGTVSFSSIPSFTEHSSAVPLTPTILNYTGGDLNFSGNGYNISNGVDYYDPALAGAGSHYLEAYVENQGCRTNIIDTVIVIDPVPHVYTQPNYDLEYTFGPGETGAAIEERVPPALTQNGTILAPVISRKGQYHQVCSGTSYDLKLTNTDNYLVYEWQMMIDNVVTPLGFGTEKTINIPSQIQTNVSFVDTTNANWNTSNYNLNGKYINLHPTLSSNTGTYSAITGDLIEVMVRPHNSSGDIGVWKKLYLGAIPTPEIDTNYNFCWNGSDGFVELDDAITSSSIYNSMLDVDSVRKVLWNIYDINDDTYQYTGNYNHNITNSNKINIFGAKVEDKSPYWVTNHNNMLYQVYYHEESDISCFSDYSSIKIVRKPEPIFEFSQTGNLEVGTPVFTRTHGSYFSPSNDEIKLTYNDGSQPYYGDSVWHYKNQLGLYSLNAVVTDSLGCFTERNFIDYWNVAGTLSIDEKEQPEEILIYPNPIVDYLNVSIEEKLKIVILDALGNRVVNDVMYKNYDLSKLSPGIYFLQLSSLDNKEELLNIKLIKI